MTGEKNEVLFMWLVFEITSLMIPGSIKSHYNAVNISYYIYFVRHKTDPSICKIIYLFYEDIFLLLVSNIELLKYKHSCWRPVVLVGFFFFFFLIQVGYLGRGSSIEKMFPTDFLQASLKALF